MRIVCAPSATDVVYCGIAVDAGTRDEHEDENGLAHFCEHLTFKGTRRRRSWHILNRMEGVGGDLNAYTGKEETIYYAAFLKEHLARATDLLTDIVLGSTYPQTEMNKEVEVVIDEIESYKDSPAELIFDDFENLVFNGHPLGRNILGEAGRLREFRSEDVNRFAARLYRPDRMVFFVYGRIEPRVVRREIERALKRVAASLPEGHDIRKAILSESFAAGTEAAPVERPSVPDYRPQNIVVEKDTHQSHVMIGARAYSALDPRHLSLYLLNNILGGPGMNSRLNLSLRERHGLVYTVESGMTAYTDTGIWSIYFGCDPHDVSRCLQLVMKELKRLADAPLPAHALEAAKRQIKGQIGISYDNFENVALGMGKRFLHYRQTQDIDRLYRKIDALTAEDLHAVARDLFRPENLTILIYR
ncbi:MAG: insulinase family protein [Paraprevotella sp.]|nr:insulinase family protein [Paraprevotella sp.]